ncbi:MAG: formylglycine-generating enzyme family protein [Candidatus Hydrogenedentes bacterium]|nr:formylglycine-generating enzyme family protein [Candidatus Hydrogenedentota bacterium]
MYTRSNARIAMLALSALLILAAGCPPYILPSDHQPGESATYAGIDFVWCPPGGFQMGACPLDGESDSSETPKHKVAIDQGFWISKHEITQAQWESVMGSNPSWFQGAIVSFVDSSNRPVENVSWDEVQSFITTINAANPGSNFRLPSEAEWEYACRARTVTRFYWGEDPFYTRIDDYAWYSDNEGVQTNDVGGKRPNGWNLYDTSGNVWEWVQDWYHEDYTGAPADGSAWENPTGTTRVIRGGSWSSASSCRASARNSELPVYSSNNVGFRLVKDEI